MTEATQRKRAGYPPTLWDLKGRKAKTRRSIATGVMVIPEATLVSFDSGSPAWNKLSITSEACKCCGVKARAFRVSWRDLEILPSDEAPELEGMR